MLKNKVAIVTGASRGLGYAIAHKFAENGAKVVLVARNQERLEFAQKEIGLLGTQSLVMAGDVVDIAFVKNVVAQTISTFGKVDIAVNCAGIISREPFEQMPFESWMRVLDVNLNGTMHFCQAVLPHMREQGSGKIINMVSQMAKLPHPGAAPSYEVSKAGQVALTRHLAFHYAKYNICINAIAPGSINTDLPKSMAPEAREKLKSAIPMLRLGEPEEVANCALFLASSMSSYITGEVIDINGGTLMD